MKIRLRSKKKFYLTDIRLCIHLNFLKRVKGIWTIVILTFKRRKKRKGFFVEYMFLLYTHWQGKKNLLYNYLGQCLFEYNLYYWNVRNDGDIGNRWIRFNEIAGCKTKEREREREEEKKKKKASKEIRAKKKERKKRTKGEIWSTQKCAEPHESSKCQVLRGKLHEHVVFIYRCRLIVKKERRMKKKGNIQWVGGEGCMMMKKVHSYLLVPWIVIK